MNRAQGAESSITSNDPECAMQANAGFEPGVMIARSTLRGALDVAEKAANDLMDKIRDVEQQRDNCVRQVGSLQEHLDTLRRIHSSQTHLVRSLMAASTQGQST